MQKQDKRCKQQFISLKRRILFILSFLYWFVLCVSSYCRKLDSLNIMAVKAMLSLYFKTDLLGGTLLLCQFFNRS